MNKVILIGRLTKDAELRFTQSNLGVATFALAVSRPYNSQNDEKQDADFINCVAWGKLADNLTKYCHKGSQVAVEGRIQTRNYQAQNGTKKYITEVICSNITFLDTKGKTEGTTQEQVNVGEIPQEANPFEEFANEVDLSDMPFE